MYVVSSSIFSFRVSTARWGAHALELELLLVFELSLMQPAELVDLVLVFPSDLDLVAHGLLVFFGELFGESSVSWVGLVDSKKLAL